MRAQPVTSRAVFTRVKTPDNKTGKLLTFAALKIDFKKSQHKNKLADDIHHILNYKIGPILKTILIHLINTLKVVQLHLYRIY